MQNFLRIVANFFKQMWQLVNFVRNLIINTCFICIILIIINHWLHTNHNTYDQHDWQGALVLNINGVVVDKAPTNGRINIISHRLFGDAADHVEENSLFEIVNIIRQAKDDHNIIGIILDLKNFIGADQPTMQYIGKALLEFRNKGKPIIAIGSNYSQEQYYLASFANKIWLSPHGTVDLHGLATHNLYYKSLLDKLKVTRHVFRVGTYKSAVEPFTRNNMSAAAREVNNRWINELWHNYLSTIAVNRQISIQQVFPGAHSILHLLYTTGGDTAKYALNYKLVDMIGSNSEIEASLIKQFGWDNKDKSYRAINMYNYANNKLFLDKEGDTVAVIFANGMIIDTTEIMDNVVGNRTVAQIRKARIDPRVKAIILRVNSPGGSVNASEIIREELIAAKAAGKPIIVSMGSVAASGGYWISTPANYIIADPNTLTGSIGIFSIVNTIERSLDYLGVHTDGVSTSPLSDIVMTKKLPSEVVQILKLSIKYNYKRFVTLVAQSRNKTPEQIEQIAQGYVWTGQDAKNNGLIDILGDFDDAIMKAVELAKLKHWHIEYYYDTPKLIDTIINNIASSVKIMLFNIIKSYLAVPTVITHQTTQIANNPSIIINSQHDNYALCLKCIN